MVNPTSLYLRQWSRRTLSIMSEHPTPRANLLSALLLTVSMALNVAAPSSLWAQREPTVHGSRLLPADSWFMDPVIRLRQRGYLRGLQPLAQPYTRDEVARELAAISPDAEQRMPRPIRQLVALLRRELSPELARRSGRDTVAVGFVASTGGVVFTNPRLDPMMPWRGGRATPDGEPREGVSGWRIPNSWPISSVGAWGETGPFAAELRLGYDLWLRRGDVDGRDPGRGFDVVPDGDLAYVSGRWTHGGFEVGRLRRNWAPVGQDGLLVSPSAFPLPQIGYSLGGSQLVLRGFVAALDTIFGTERFLTAHSLQFQRGDFALSIGEGKVYGSTSGVKLQSFLPLESTFLTLDKVPGELPANVMIDGQLWWRIRSTVLTGEWLVDDFWVIGRAPSRMALSGGLRWVPNDRTTELGVEYRGVQSLTYHSIEPRRTIDGWTFWGRGLGDNFSDYDRARVYGHWFPSVAGLRLSPSVAFQRRGEWDFRRPAVPDSVFRQMSSFLQGTPERMVRLALAGRYQPNRRVATEWDAGWNRVTNVGHVRGKTATEFQGTVRVGITWSAPNRETP